MNDNRAHEKKYWMLNGEEMLKTPVIPKRLSNCLNSNHFHIKNIVLIIAFSHLIKF